MTRLREKSVFVAPNTRLSYQPRHTWLQQWLVSSPHPIPRPADTKDKERGTLMLSKRAGDAGVARAETVDEDEVVEVAVVVVVDAATGEEIKLKMALTSGTQPDGTATTNFLRIGGYPTVDFESSG